MLEILERLWTIGITAPEPTPEAPNWPLILDAITAVTGIASFIAVVFIWWFNAKLLKRQIVGTEPILSATIDERQIMTVTFINSRTYPVVLRTLHLAHTDLNVVDVETQIGYSNYRGVTVVEINKAVAANHFLDTKFYLASQDNERSIVDSDMWVRVKYIDPHHGRLEATETTII